MSLIVLRWNLSVSDVALGFLGTPVRTPCDIIEFLCPLMPITFSIQETWIALFFRKAALLLMSQT